MKEYLIKDPETGKYWASNSKDEYGFVCEIPEGAEYLTSLKDNDRLIFWRDGFKKCQGKDYYWISTQFTAHDYVEGHQDKGASIVWQRKSTSTLIEYLDPSTWTLHNVDVDNDAAGEDWIKVPEGAEQLTKSGSELVFWKDGGKFSWHTANSNEWDDNVKLELTTLSMYGNEYIVWQRHTQPEELPFIDDEPKTMGLLSNTSINTATGHHLDNLANICGFRSRKYLETDSMYRESFIEFNNGRHEVFFNENKPAKSTNPWQNQEGGNHYKDLKIQPMQYALENKLDYAQANVVKYVTRHASKNGKEDLLKAIHNIELMIDYYYGGDK